MIQITRTTSASELQLPEKEHPMRSGLRDDILAGLVALLLGVALVLLSGID